MYLKSRTVIKISNLQIKPQLSLHRQVRWIQSYIYSGMMNQVGTRFQIKSFHTVSLWLASCLETKFFLSLQFNAFWWQRISIWSKFLKTNLSYNVWKPILIKPAILYLFKRSIITRPTERILAIGILSATMVRQILVLLSEECLLMQRNKS